MFLILVFVLHFFLHINNDHCYWLIKVQKKKKKHMVSCQVGFTLLYFNHSPDFYK